MKNYSLLTIFILSHDCENLIGKTLNSLLNQTYPNFEIIVSDNQSSDKTVEVIKSFQQKYPKINLRHNIPRVIPGATYDGCYDNSNGCLRSGLIKGEFVAICHGDDIYEKDFAEKEVEFLASNPEAGAVFSCANIINMQDKKTGELKLPEDLKGKNLFNFMEIFGSLMLNGNCFLQSLTFMARKKTIEDIGIFDEERFATSRDLAMWLRILEKYPIGILDDILVSWRYEKGKLKSQYLCTERADFFNVMDYYLNQKRLILKIDRKHLRQYHCQKRFNDTLRAMNFLIKGEEKKAKEIVNKKASLDDFRAFFEKITFRKTEGELLRLALILGINLKLGKRLGIILNKLRYG